MHSAFDLFTPIFDMSVHLIIEYNIIFYSMLQVLHIAHASQTLLGIQQLISVNVTLWNI